MRSEPGKCRAIRSWTLFEGRAQTFAPDKDGILRVQSGRAWVTMHRPNRYSGSVARVAIADDDLFLGAHASLSLRAGQAVVIESWSVAPTEGVTLVWEAETGMGLQHWQGAVVQPAHEFLQGLRHAGAALARMLKGLLSCTALLLVRRHKLR